jgi:hypothetical protein
MIRTSEILAAAIGVALAILGMAASASAESASMAHGPEFRGGWLYRDVGAANHG